MSFSIITVVLNAADDLPLTIESIIQQDFDDFEFIVVDGGSNDGTHDIIERYASKIDKIISIEDAGIFYAMNKALDECTKEFSIFMNAKDRFYDKDVLSKIGNRIEGSPDFVYGDHIYIYKDNYLLHRSALFYNIFQNLVRGEVSATWLSLIPCHQATFTRTSTLKKLRYDTRYELCADHELMFRAYEAGYKFQYIDEIICHYMGGGVSAQRSERLGLEQSYLYRQYSTKPSNIDRLIIERSDSPFSNYSRKTGLLLTGFQAQNESIHTLESSLKFRWCYGPSFAVITPFDRPVWDCIIEGFNELEHQYITIQDNTKVVAAGPIPVGLFVERFILNGIVNRKTVIEFFLDIYGNKSNNTHGSRNLAISNISFSLSKTDIKPLIMGSEYIFDEEHSSITEEFFISGWSQQEKQHRWSVGYQSVLLLKIEESVNELVILLSPNPFAPLEKTRIEIEVNGVFLSSYDLLIGKQDIRIPCKCSCWSKGTINTITFKNKFAVSPPGDPRLLGVCLYKLNTV